jgi:hypothetical protein
MAGFRKCETGTGQQVAQHLDSYKMMMIISYIYYKKFWKELILLLSLCYLRIL